MGSCEVITAAQQVSNWILGLGEHWAGSRASLSKAGLSKAGEQHPGDEHTAVQLHASTRKAKLCCGAGSGNTLLGVVPLERDQALC